MSPNDLKRCTREQRLAWFARQIITAAWHGDVDAMDVQEWAVAAGLIYAETVTENTDMMNVENAECLEIGDTLYRESRDLVEAQPAKG